MIGVIRLCCCIGLLPVLPLGHFFFSSGSALQLTHGPSEMVLTDGPGREWFTFVKVIPASNETSEQEEHELWLGSWSEPFKSRRLFISADDWDSFTWSPDGKWIAYATLGQLHKLNLSSRETVQLTSFPSVKRFGPELSWSLDGRIYALRDCTLIAVSATGGDVEELMSIEGPIFSDWSCSDDYSSCSPDGRFLVVQMSQSYGVVGRDSFTALELVLVDIKTGRIRDLTSRNWDMQPTWIDSQTILFSRISTEGAGAVLELDVLSGSVRELASGSLFVGPVVRHANGEWIVVGKSSETQKMQLDQQYAFSALENVWSIFLKSRLWKIEVKRH